MIGVDVQASERPAAREFFELFKTSWEFQEPDRKYEVLISTVESPTRSSGATLTLYYGTGFKTFDTEHSIFLRNKSNGGMLLYEKYSFPIYGVFATFPASPLALVIDDLTRESAITALRSGTETVIRVGYNFLSEIQFLLSVGQPAKNAFAATLDLHITLLRDLITRANIPVAEIPPVPAGHKFMVCLTHDVDHPLMRNHRWDHTMFGFLYRATIVSAANVCRGRISFGRMLQNWAAVVCLPFVHLGLAEDIWSRFDRYLEIEAGLGSTYFVIPQRDNPGRRRDSIAPHKRACRYTLADLEHQLRKIKQNGNEVSLHGLDAWHDAQAARQESERLLRALGNVETGVRMHWLYFDANSYRVLDEAGFVYDSTVGYNETVGYRAGTAQVYRPLGTDKLLELPLHVMDTALFYSEYLNLSEPEAARLLSRLLDDIEGFGGVLTVNWHDRSIFPERLWKAFYLNFVNEMKQRQAWFPTAARAVAWFQKRRNASIESIRFEGARIHLRSRAGDVDMLPGLIIRIHRPCPRNKTEPLASGARASYFDVRFDTSLSVELEA